MVGTGRGPGTLSSTTAMGFAEIGLAIAAFPTSTIDPERGPRSSFVPEMHHGLDEALLDAHQEEDNDNGVVLTHSPPSRAGSTSPPSPWRPSSPILSVDSELGLGLRPWRQPTLLRALIAGYRF